MAWIEFWWANNEGAMALLKRLAEGDRPALDFTLDGEPASGLLGDTAQGDAGLLGCVPPHGDGHVPVRRVRTVRVAGREPAGELAVGTHLGDHRHAAHRLRAARDHNIGIAQHDQPRGIANGMSAGGAGRDPLHLRGIHDLAGCR